MSRIFTKGFTLIELLVVIAIIGLLSSVVLASLNQARAKSRDGARVQTVAQLKNALELYYAENKHYPIYSAETRISDLVGPGKDLNQYMKSITPNFSVVVNGTTLNPTYQSDATGGYYELALVTESGGVFSKNMGCSQLKYNSIPGTSKYCYGNNPAGLASGGGGGNGGSGPTLTATPDRGSNPQSLTWSTTGMTGVNYPCNISADTINASDNGWTPAPSSGTIYLPQVNESGYFDIENPGVSSVTITISCSSNNQTTPAQSFQFNAGGGN